MELNPPLSPLTHHRNNINAPHVRPKHRSRLYSCHAQEGGPRSPQKTCGGIGKKISPTLGIECHCRWRAILKIIVLFLPDIKFEMSRALSDLPRPPGGSDSLKICSSQLTRWLYERCKFGSYRSTIKGTLP